MGTANKQCSARCQFCNKKYSDDQVNIVEDVDQTEKFICRKCLPLNRRLAIVRMRVPNERI